MSAITVDTVSVSYGSARGIVDVSLAIEQGQVTGLLGPNGAGKTTLLRTILDLVRPQQGSVSILGRPVRDPDSRADVTYLPGDLVLPGRLTGHAVLRRFAMARPLPDPGAVEALAHRLDLDLDRPVGQLSKGNRQKVGLVLAFAAQARILILDEPTSGLDPLLQAEFASLVAEQVAQGATVLLSSHVLSELETLAGSVAVLREGRLIAHEGIEALRARARQAMSVTLASDDQARACATALGVADVSASASGPQVALTVQGSPDRVIKVLSGFDVVRLHTHGSDLAEVFLEFYGRSDDG